MSPLIVALIAAAWVASVVIASEPHGSRGKAGPPPESWLQHDGDHYWEQQAEAAKRDALSRVRTQAASWEKTLGALLGSYSLILFLGSPDVLKSNAPESDVVIAALVTAAVLSVAALALAALAAQGSPTVRELVDGWRYKQWHSTQAAVAARRLTLSRCCAGLAIAAALTASVSGWAANASDTTTVRVDGETDCATLEIEDGGLTIAGDPLSDGEEIALTLCGD